MRIDIQEVWTAVEAVATNFAVLCRSGIDPNRPVPGLTWNVAETAAHVVTVLGRATAGLPNPARDVEDVRRLNAEEIASLTERDPVKLAPMVAEHMASLRGVLPTLPGEMPVRFHGGLRIPLATACGVILGELVVHGYDIARASSADWTIEPRHAWLTMASLSGLLPHYVRTDTAAGLTATIEFAPTDAPGLVYRFDDGRLTFEEPGRPPDCTITGGAAMVMLVQYQRLTAAQAGLVVAGELFVSP